MPDGPEDDGFTTDGEDETRKAGAVAAAGEQGAAAEESAEESGEESDEESDDADEDDDEEEGYAQADREQLAKLLAPPPREGAPGTAGAEGGEGAEGAEVAEATGAAPLARQPQDVEAAVHRCLVLNREMQRVCSEQLALLDEALDCNSRRRAELFGGGASAAEVAAARDCDAERGTVGGGRGEAVAPTEPGTSLQRSGALVEDGWEGGWEGAAPPPLPASGAHREYRCPGEGAFGDGTDSCPPPSRDTDAAEALRRAIPLGSNLPDQLRKWTKPDRDTLRRGVAQAALQRRPPPCAPSVRCVQFAAWSLGCGEREAHGASLACSGGEHESRRQEGSAGGGEGLAGGRG